jgi:hypothetical protein
VTRLRKMMLEELQRRNYSTITTRNYLRVVADFARYFGKSGGDCSTVLSREEVSRLINQSSTAGFRTRARHFSLEELCPRRQTRPDDPRRHGILTALLSARAPQRIRAHPPLRVSGESRALLILSCAGNCWPPTPLRPQKPERAKFPPRVLPSGTARVAAPP